MKILLISLVFVLSKFGMATSGTALVEGATSSITAHVANEGNGCLTLNASTDTTINNQAITNLSAIAGSAASEGTVSWTCNTTDQNYRVGDSTGDETTDSVCTISSKIYNGTFATDAGTSPSPSLLFADESSVVSDDNTTEASAKRLMTKFDDLEADTQETLVVTASCVDGTGA